MMMNKKVLIIGASGFIGKYLHQCLLQNKNWTPYKSSEFNVDITNIESIDKCICAEKFDAIVNLSGIATLDIKDRSILFSINSFGVDNLLSVLDSHNFKGKVILTSSAYVYAASDLRQKLDETDLLSPNNLYGCSKILAENFSNLYSERLNITIARPFNAIGVGHKKNFLLPKIIHAFKNNLPEIELGNLDVSRDYSDVRDVARMYECLLEKNNVPNIINFCNGYTASVEELIANLEEITSHRMIVKSNPKFMRKNDVLYQCGSTQRLEDLGFSWRYSLKSTLRWMLSEES